MTKSCNVWRMECDKEEGAVDDEEEEKEEEGWRDTQSKTKTRQNCKEKWCAHWHFSRKCTIIYMKNGGQHRWYLVVTPAITFTARTFQCEHCLGNYRATIGCWNLQICNSALNCGISTLASQFGMPLINKKAYIKLVSFDSVFLVCCAATFGFWYGKTSAITRSFQLPAFARLRSWNPYYFAWPLCMIRSEHFFPALQNDQIFSPLFSNTNLGIIANDKKIIEIQFSVCDFGV